MSVTGGGLTIQDLDHIKLHIARREEGYDYVTSLTEYSDVDIYALASAIRYEGNTDSVIKKLLKKRESRTLRFALSIGYKIKVINRDKQTAIHLAFYSFDINILKIDSIFFQCEEDVNYTDRYGLSHLHVACAVGNLETTVHFLQKGEDMDARCSIKGPLNNFTPLLFAVKYENKRIVEYLLSKGVDSRITDCLGRLPIHLACPPTPAISFKRYLDWRRCNLRSFEWPRHLVFNVDEDLRIMNLLIRQGSDINAKDQFGNTPLMYIFQSHFDCPINEFYDKSLFVYDVPTDEYRKIRKIQSKKLNILLQHKVDVTAVNVKGDTALHWAINSLKPLRKPKERYNITFNDSSIVKMICQLLENGANVNAINNNKETPLQKAVLLLSKDIVEILLKYNADVHSLEFRTDSFFHYYNLLPSLKVIENLLDILELLSKRERYLDLSEKLIVLNFLVNHGVHFNPTEELDVHYSLHNRICFGTLMTFNKTLHTTSQATFLSQDFRDKCRIYSFIMEIGNFYIDEEMKTEITKLRSLSSFDAESDIRMEAEKLKTLMIRPGISVYDILSMSPQRAYPYLKHRDYRKFTNTIESLKYYSTILEGHITKSLIRGFIMDSAKDYLRVLSCVNLPDLCCEKILRHLSNEEQYSMCLAIFQKKRVPKIKNKLANSVRKKYQSFRKRCSLILRRFNRFATVVRLI